MNSDNSSDASSAAGSAAAAALRTAGRRRLLRGSLGASPVLLTFVSRPASAITCLSASATISANASGKSGITGPGTGCNGIGPLGWLNAPTSYPGGVSPSTRFSNYFGGYTDRATFGSVLAEANTLRGNEPSKLRRNLVAGVLNILDSRLASSIIDIAKLQSIWNQLGTSTSATWLVNPNGLRWNAAQTNLLWFDAHLFTGAV